MLLFLQNVIPVSYFDGLETRDQSEIFLFLF